jgi:hypothetical protein
MSTQQKEKASKQTAKQCTLVSFGRAQILREIVPSFGRKGY